MYNKAISELLKDKFASTKNVDALVAHFQGTVDAFQKRQWEPALTKAGKFVEAVLKALWAHVGNIVPKSKDFKVDTIIRDLGNLNSTAAEDTIRLTIPRACRFIYEIASNRGARHDPDEVNPNEMDANAVVALCSWVLAEMVRFSQKGAIDLTRASELVAAMTQKKFPVVEEIDGRVYFHLKGLSAREVALLTLWRAHPGRRSAEELIKAARRHGSSRANAKLGISRLKHVTDDDGAGNLKLLTPGILEAEHLISTAPPKGPSKGTSLNP